MGLQFPRSVGAISGWMMTAFIMGVGIQSFFRFRFVTDEFFIATAVLLGLVYLVSAKRKQYLLPLLLIAFVFGMWRVHLAPKPTLRFSRGHAFMASMRASSEREASSLERWRLFITSRLKATLPPDDAALVAGILYGERGLSTAQKEEFRSAGLLHIVAVSGSNVTLVVQFLSMVMLGLGLRRRHAFWATSFALIAFVGFVGFAASVARAAFMGWLILVAREVGRMASPFRLLLVAATALLLLNPWQLLYDVGFALSFLAMWGLLAWAPLFKERLAFLPERFGIRDSVALTVAATLMTAPYLAWAFGRMSLAGLATNVLALPLIPFVMGSGVLLALWGTLPGHELVSLPAEGLSDLLQKIAGLTKHVPWLDLQLETMEFSTCLATYALIVYLWRQWSGKNDFSTGK